MERLADANKNKTASTFIWDSPKTAGACGAAEPDAGPSFDDLTGSLRFSPREGRIWLDNERISLVYLSTLGAIRNELIDRLGHQEARGLLTRMGYMAGTQDAALARKLRVHSLRDAFLLGPQLHSLQGMVCAEPVHIEGDAATGHFYAEVIWHRSFDAETHLAAYGHSDQAVCWIQLGYATGYSSAFMGRPILYKEVECRATGSPHCRIIGKPLDQWDPLDTVEERRALQPEFFANRFAAGELTSPSTSTHPENPLLQTSTIPLDLVGASPGFNMTCHMLKKVADTSATVLFLGETGVGKGVFAKTLHQISSRSGRPFVALNCAAIPENLIEAELFGVEKGAFTGATQSRPGRFERAHRGTLFLDEVGTLTMAAQVKLLRALQDKEIERLGDTTSRVMDVRIIAATNEDLHAAVKAGRFREDLLYRLNVFPIHIPPLRERREDIPMLMDNFLRRFAQAYDKQITGFTDLAVDTLYGYDYPGNIRELENLIERAVILAEDHHPIDFNHLFDDEEQRGAMQLKLTPTGSLQSEQQADDNEEALLDEVLNSQTSLDDIEYQLLAEALKRADGNLAEASRMLGVKRAHASYLE